MCLSIKQDLLANRDGKKIFRRVSERAVILDCRQAQQSSDVRSVSRCAMRARAFTKSARARSTGHDTSSARLTGHDRQEPCSIRASFLLINEFVKIAINDMLRMFTLLIIKVSSALLAERIRLIFEIVWGKRLMLRKSIIAIRASSTETAAPTLP